MSLLLLLTAFLLPACDDAGEPEDTGAAEEIGCDWFAADNCWRASVTAAMACVPAGGIAGEFDGTRSTCTGEDGSVVRFATPVPTDDFSDYSWDFDVEAGGSACLSFVSDAELSVFTCTPAGA